MNPMSRMKIAVKLPLIMIAMTLATVLATALFGFREAARDMRGQTVEQLKMLASARADVAEILHDSFVSELRMQAGGQLALGAMRSLQMGYASLTNAPAVLVQTYVTGNPNAESGRERFIGPENGNDFDVAHRRYHGILDDLRNTLQLYDIFLIDVDGNVIYSVYKEADFAQNVLSSPLSDTGLGKVFRAAVTLRPGDDPAEVDFSKYAPSGNRPSAFLGSPVYDETGAMLGVMVYQVSAAAMEQAVSDVQGIGEQGTVYIVGSDQLLRAEARDDIARAVLSQRIDNPAVAGALDGQSATYEYTGSGGYPVMAHSQPVALFGSTWALVAEGARDELLAATATMKRHFLIIAVVTCIVATGFSIVLARSISAPLARVSGAMGHIAEGHYDTHVPETTRGDEIGGMSRQLDAFRNALDEADAIGREAAFKSAGFENASSAMLMVDSDFNVTFLNTAMIKLFDEKAEDFRKLTGGLGARELIGINMDRFHALPDRVRQVVTRPGALPMRTVVKIGTTFFSLMISAVHDRSGKQAGMVIEWKNETKSLRDSTIIAALDTNSVRIEVRQDGRLGWVNSFVCRRTGRKVEELLNLDADSLITLRPNGNERMRKVSDIVRSRETVSCEAVFRLNSLEMRIDATLSPMDDPQGKPAGLVLVGNDVTEERSTLEAANAERARTEREQAQVVESLRQGLTRLSEGDLTTRIETEFAPQYEQLRQDFNGATQRLEAAIGSIAESAGAIRSDTSGISSASQSLSKRTETQAATLEETAAALDNLTGSVRTAAEGATNAALMVRETRSNVETSGGVVHEAVGAMGEIEKFSNEISSISGVIDEIAFQTNLLALNAGVEAARAGEAGRGFAVVASEVRALARRSSDAAREINSLISSSGTQIKRGVTLVSKAGEVLTKMLESVSNISGSVESIAQSATDQSRGLQEINSAVNQLDRVTQQNAAMFEQTTAASLALAEEAEALTRAMSQFTTAQTRATSSQAAAAPMRAAS